MTDSPIKKEVQIGDCRLLLGDCLEIIPTLESVNCIITDPPYGTEFVGGYSRSGETIKNDKDLTVVDACFRAIGLRFSTFWLAAFHSPRNVHEFCAATDWLTYRGGVIWDKKAPGMGGALRYQHEMISVFSAGVPAPMKPLFSVIRSYRDAEQHPHQKPIDLMERVVDTFPGEVTLDPFMGSGSTLVACAKLGRAAIGIELDEKHFETSCKRIEEAYKQPDFFVSQPSEKPTQEALFE